MAKTNKISKSDFKKVMEQNRKMREILKNWPARQIMMDYEKEWNEKRLKFFAENGPVEIEL